MIETLEEVLPMKINESKPTHTVNGKTFPILTAAEAAEAGYNNFKVIPKNVMLQLDYRPTRWHNERWNKQIAQQLGLLKMHKIIYDQIVVSYFASFCPDYDPRSGFSFSSSIGIAKKILKELNLLWEIAMDSPRFAESDFSNLRKFRARLLEI